MGQVRTRNEDSCGEFVGPAGQRLLVVADGMGGHKAGAEASRLAVETVGEIFASSTLPPDEMLEVALESANDRIYAVAQSDSELRGMGTTAVALLFCPDGSTWVAHVGDSRAYRLRRGQFEPITRDHSVVAELERRGHLTAEEAAVHPRRNEILRSVGVQPTVEVEVAPVDLEDGDIYVLCSDGLSGMVSDVDMSAVVAGYSLDDAADLLIRMANDAGGQDNVTVQLARYGLPDAIVEEAPTSEAEVFDDAPPRRRRGPTRRQMAVVVAAVLIAGLAALTILWRIYNVTQTRNVPEPVAAEAPASPER